MSFKFDRFNAVIRPVKIFRKSVFGALLYSCAAFAMTPDAAYAASCTDIANLGLSLADNTLGGLSAQVVSLPATLEPGDVVTFNVAVTGGSGTVRITVNGSPGGAQNGTVVGNFAPPGSAMFTATGSGQYDFLYDVDGGAGTLAVTITATCVAGTPPPPPPPPPPPDETTTDDGDEKRKITEGVTRPFEGTQVGEEPANLPGKGDGGGGGEDPEKTIEELKAEIAEIEVELHQFEVDYAYYALELGKNQIIISSGAHIGEEYQISELEDKIAQLHDDIRGIELDIQGLETGDFTPSDSGGDLFSDVIAYQSQENRSADNRWQLGSNNHLQSYSLLPNGLFGDSVTIGAVYDLWTRVKISVIDGSLGRDGLAFSGQLGVVRSLSDRVDGGVFISLFHGDVDFDAMTTDIRSFGYGGGAYLKFQLTDLLRAGISTSYQHSDNDISIGAATGSFDSGRTTLDASLSGSFALGEVRVIPTANLSWVRTDRESYTDSTATLVPGSTDDVVIATGALNFSRTFRSSRGNIETMTPSAGISANFNLDKVDDVIFADGSRIETSSVTGAVNTGLTMRFISGHSVNLTAGANGIGGDTQSYTGAVRFSVPLD